MWIVRLALSRPYTFIVAALLLLLVTPFFPGHLILRLLRSVPCFPGVSRLFLLDRLLILVGHCKHMIERAAHLSF